MGIMNLAEIMDRSVEVLRKYIKTILSFALIYGIIAVIGIIALIFAGGIFATLAITPSKGFIIPGIAFSLLIAFIVSFYLASSVGIIKISSQEFLEEKVYAYEAMKASFGSIFKIFGIIVITVLMFLPVLGIFGGIGYYLYGVFRDSMIPYDIYRVKEIILIIASITALLAAAVVTMAYITLFLFSLHALAIENKGVIGSIKRSYALVKNNFWKIFGAFLLFNLTLFAIRTSMDSLFAIIAGGIYFVIKFLNLQQDFVTLLTMAYVVSRWPLSLLSWLIISPIGTAMLTFMYFNQRFKKEGYDMLLKLKEIQKNNERKLSSEIDEHGNSL